ncbi:hypothetical protein NQ318_016702 [Aromia moschata]|uniref:Uncharacterized protein n=1 Tax=Aromia moschata TaxID=1265417 RepID=A0AAV8XMX6_9CUCU|nr:hypothetical protein NQ318_016702 [Aromia moschata]
MDTSKMKQSQSYYIVVSKTADYYHGPVDGLEANVDDIFEESDTERSNVGRTTDFMSDLKLNIDDPDGLLGMTSKTQKQL